MSFDPMYYDRAGKPITIDEYAELLKGCAEYSRVARTKCGTVTVSTVWLGINHNFMDAGAPIIFESMLFDSDEGDRDGECVRYCTEAEALEGHAALVASLGGVA